jgi:hypothetical protein
MICAIALSVQTWQCQAPIQEIALPLDCMNSAFQGGAWEREA